MTKYPIKHTMVFGDVRCDYCGGTGRKINIPTLDGVCPKCAGEGTIPLSVTFDLVKACPECGGEGSLQFSVDPDDGTFCPNCSDNGLPVGKVPRYWTPEEAAEHIKKETGIDADDFRQFHYICQENALPKVHVAFLYQPAPPADYRPE